MVIGMVVIVMIAIVGVGGRADAGNACGAYQDDNGAPVYYLIPARTVVYIKYVYRRMYIRYIY